MQKRKKQMVGLFNLSTLQEELQFSEMVLVGEEI